MFDASEFFFQGFSFPENYAHFLPQSAPLAGRLLKTAGFSLMEQRDLNSSQNPSNRSSRIFFEQACRQGDISRGFAEYGWYGYAVDPELSHVRQAILKCSGGVSFACGPLETMPPELSDLSFLWHCALGFSSSGFSSKDPQGVSAPVNVEARIKSLRQSTKIGGIYMFDIKNLHPAQRNISGHNKVLVHLPSPLASDLASESKGGKGQGQDKKILATLSWEREWERGNDDEEKSTTVMKVTHAENLLWQSGEIVEHHFTQEAIDEILKPHLDSVRWMGNLDGDRPSWHHKRLIAVVKRLS